MLFNEQLEPVETDLLATASLTDGDQAEPEEEQENEEEVDEDGADDSESAADGEEVAEDDASAN